MEKEIVQPKFAKVDGPISKYLNRRFSVPMALLLKNRYWITPNKVSGLSLVLAGVSALFYILGGRVLPFRITMDGLVLLMPPVVLGGLFAQISSVVDGVDGDLARVRGTSSNAGAVLDAILDRYADIIILAGLTFAVKLEGNFANLFPFGLLQVPLTVDVLILLFVLALSGSLLVSYSRAKLEHAELFRPEGRTFLGATRDVRLFLIFICSLLSCPLLALFIIAVSGNLTVAARLKTVTTP